MYSLYEKIVGKCKSNAIILSYYMMSFWANSNQFDLCLQNNFGKSIYPRIFQRWTFSFVSSLLTSLKPLETFFLKHGLNSQAVSSQIRYFHL